ncbi:MAG: helix-turn-helix transcriptional regulator [Anaerolineae bacterium]|nr:helix-turn-helix transcriptional regulator [Anaerolineae bacterium]MDW8071419.1 helix-turn-helix transcriptional regulator [Anaerolineae bacterium]
MTQQRLVEWIEAERKRRGWSLRRLAREAGLTPAQISEVLSGHSRPGIRFYLGMWRALHVSVDYLLQLAGELPPGPDENPTLQELIQLARRLPAEVQAEVYRYCVWRSQEAGAIDVPSRAAPDRAESATTA